MGWAFWIGVVITVWYIFREIITILIGANQEGALIRGQRLCHFTIVVFCITGIFIAFWLGAYWPMYASIVLSIVFRSLVRASGSDRNIPRGE